MGGSQSKFRPEPKDFWYKMRIKGKQPRFLQTVMQAISDLREVSGSSQNKIVDYVKGVVNEKNVTPRPRNVTMQVKKALRHAVENGLIKQHGGKFRMALNLKDFAIFKSFQAVDPLTDCNFCKKGRKGKKRGRRGRRRKRSFVRLRNSLEMLSRRFRPRFMDYDKRNHKIVELQDTLSTENIERRTSKDKSRSKSPEKVHSRSSESVRKSLEKDRSSSEKEHRSSEKVRAASSEKDPPKAEDKAPYIN